jgi:hypothetical protein
MLFRVGELSEKYSESKHFQTGCISLHFFITALRED